LTFLKNPKKFQYSLTIFQFNFTAIFFSENMRFARKELGKHQEYNVKKASTFEKQLKQREKIVNTLKNETKIQEKKKRVLKINFLDCLEEKLEKFDKKAKKLEKKKTKLLEQETESDKSGQPTHNFKYGNGCHYCQGNHLVKYCPQKKQEETEREDRKDQIQGVPKHRLEVLDPNCPEY